MDGAKVKLETKNLVLIHTFEGDEYVKLFPGTHIVRPRDGEKAAVRHALHFLFPLIK
jgi:hypothetical protein